MSLLSKPPALPFPVAQSLSPPVLPPNPWSINRCSPRSSHFGFSAAAEVKPPPAPGELGHPLLPVDVPLQAVKVELTYNHGSNNINPAGLAFVSPTQFSVTKPFKFN